MNTNTNPKTFNSGESMKPITDIASIEAYVMQFSNALADKVNQNSEPLHDPATMPNHHLVDSIGAMNGIKLLEKQKHAVTGMVKAIDKNGLGILGCNMGTGKTPQALSVAHCHANGRPYNALVLCPPHLTTKWVDEVHKFLGKTTSAVIIENWQQFLELRYAPPPKGACWYIMAMTTAKLGYTKRCAAVRKIKKFHLEGLGQVRREVLTCSRCAHMVKTGKGIPATADDIEKNWLHCTGMWCSVCGESHNQGVEHCPAEVIVDGKKTICGHKLRRCGEALWQQNNHKVSPAQYVRSKGCKMFTYFVRDEAHESKGSDSIDGHAATLFAKYAKYTLLATGTLLAGKSEDIRPLLFRLKPRDFLRFGFGWRAEIEFAKRYGRIQTVEKSSTGGTKRKSGTGSSKSTTQDVKPGIMPQLYPDFVCNYTVFMSLPEIASELPSYHEETKMVPMEGEMQAEYKQMQERCLADFRTLYVSNPGIAMKLLGPMLEAFMTWPDVPYDRKDVGYTEPITQSYVRVYKTADLDRTVIYPKEKALMDYIKAEKKLGRKCWVYAVRDDTRDRLQLMLESNGFKVASLKATVKASSRIEWLRKYAPDCDVGLCHPELVQTGLELFGPRFNFPTLCWYSTGFKLNVLRQASKRSWRIGQKEDCKTVYFYYGDSAQQTAVGVMASKLVAAEAIEGKFSDGGLADESVDDDVALAVARSLADNIKVKVAERYRPVDAANSAEDRYTMMRNRIASIRNKMRS